MTASHTGMCGTATGAPCAGHWLLAPQEGQPVTFSSWAPGRGRGDSRVSRLQGLSYHKFLDSPAQERGFGAGSETTDGQPQGTGFGGEHSQIPQ